LGGWVGSREVREEREGSRRTATEVFFLVVLRVPSRILRELRVNLLLCYIAADAIVATAVATIQRSSSK
jgi:hypothetical protein